MSPENQPNYYAIIPSEVRYDKNLSANAKLMYGEITALSNKEGYCWANNKYFAELYGVSNRAVSGWISQLNECGYISLKIRYKGGSKEILQRYIRIKDIPPGEKLPDLTKKTSIGNEKNCENNTININNTSSNSISKDILRVSGETHNPSLKNTPEKENPSCKIVEYWNSKKNLRTHKRNTKTYANAARLVRILQAGQFGKMYHIEDKYARKNNITVKDLRKKYSDEDIMKAIDSYDLMCSPDYGSEYKDKYPKDFSTFLYNSSTERSFFLSRVKDKKPPLKKIEKILEEEVYKLYRATFFRKQELNRIEESELIRGVNFVVRRQREYHKTIGQYFTPFAFRGKEFYRNHINFLIDEYFDKGIFDVTKLRYESVWKKYIIYMKQTRGSECDLNPSANKVRKAKQAFERSKNIA